VSAESNYRPDIDGLRAIAVLSVIGFHAFPQWVPGGFVGVDVFFVISGFLITGIIVRELKSDTFSFATFYMRRVRRIFPSLIVVLTFCFAVGWRLLLPDEFTSLGRNIFGGAAFVSNWVLLHETGYFDVDAARKPLLHLWSLGIEEQFYLVWPPVLLIASRIRWGIGWVIAAILAASFIANVATIGSDPASTFYWPFTRAWELMIGGALAWFANQGVQIFASPTWLDNKDSRSLLGLGLIVAAVFALNRHSTFPGWWALLPTAGTALLISARDAWINRYALVRLKFVGLISYPLYLWHWPLLSFQTIIDPDGASVLMRAGIVVVSVVLAWLTYEVVEKPIRFGKPIMAGAAAAAMAALGCVGLATVHYDGFATRIPVTIRALTTAVVDNSSWRGGACFLDGKDEQFAPECLDNARRPLLLLWGDSYAASLYQGLKALQASQNFGLAQYTIAGCPPIPGFVVKERPHCVASNDAVLAIIRAAKPDVILIYSIWSSYPGFSPDKIDATIAALRDVKESRIVLMGPPPMWAGGLPQAMYEEYRAHRLEDAAALPERTRLHLAAGVTELDNALRAKAAALGVEYISAWNKLCNSSGCLTRVGDDLITFDYGHFTVPGAKYLGAKIAPALFPDR